MENSTFTRNGATQIFISARTEIDLVFRATIKPAYQRRIRVPSDRFLVYVVASLRIGAVKLDAKVTSNQRLFSLASLGVDAPLLPWRYW
jgi:hypothetical protein